MQTLSQESLSMTISTLSANWCGGINQACAVCFDNSREAISLWLTILPRKLFYVLIRTSARSAVKRVSPPGFTGSHIIVFGNTRAGGKNLSASTKSNCRASTIPKWPILV